MRRESISCNTKRISWDEDVLDKRLDPVYMRVNLLSCSVLSCSVLGCSVLSRFVLISFVLIRSVLNRLVLFAPS